MRNVFIVLLLLIASPVWGDTATVQEGVGGCSGSVDVDIDEYNADTNYETNTTINIEAEFSSAEEYILLQADFSCVTGFSGGTVTAGTLSMYQASNTGYAGEYHLYEYLNSWDESTATWNNIGRVSGTDYTATPEDTWNESAYAAAGWRTWDVTDLVNAYAQGTKTNNGFLIRDDNVSGLGPQTFRSSEHATTSERWKIDLTYTPSGGGGGETRRKQLMLN